MKIVEGFSKKKIYNFLFKSNKIDFNHFLLLKLDLLPAVPLRFLPCNNIQLVLCLRGLKFFFIFSYISVAAVLSGNSPNKIFISFVISSLDFASIFCDSSRSFFVMKIGFLILQPNCPDVI